MILEGQGLKKRKYHLVLQIIRNILIEKHQLNLKQSQKKKILNLTVKRNSKIEKGLKIVKLIDCFLIIQKLKNYYLGNLNFLERKGLKEA